MSDVGNEHKWASLVGADVNEDDDEEEDDDVHVCGGCKQQFSKIDIFVSHKKECKAKNRKKAVAKSDNRVSVIVDLGGKEAGSSGQEAGRRDADEAAVISLLANQLSNNQVHISHPRIRQRPAHLCKATCLDCHRP